MDPGSLPDLIGIAPPGNTEPAGEERQQMWADPGVVTRAIEAGALDGELTAIASALNAPWAEQARRRVDRALQNISM